MPRTHKPLVPRPPVEDDWLLSPAQVAKRLGMSRSAFYAYWPRFLCLIDGARSVRTVARSARGCIRFLRSKVIEHMHIELREGAELSPADSETTIARRNLARQNELDE